MDVISYALAKKHTNEKIAEQKLKVAKVEHELNDLKGVLQQVNINHEAKQKVSGYGIINLPENAANGQVSAILKGNTWTNRAGIGDTSPQTIENLDSAKTYLLIKTDGGTVNVDAVDTAVPAKITGKTSTVLTWASGKIALYELSTAEAALTEAQLGARYHYVSGTKSTVGAFRLQSKDAEDNVVSESYVTVRDAEGNIEQLRSLPNGTKDEVNVTEGIKTKRIKKAILNSSQITNYGTSYSNVDVVEFANVITDNKPWISAVDGMCLVDGSSEIASSEIDNIDNIGKFYTNFNTIWFIVAKGAYLSKTDAQAKFPSQALIYQLATPIEIPIQTSGTLVSYPSGTVYIEPYVADAGIYTDKMEVLYSDLPIKALEKISKVDFDTGLETELDITAAVIAEDKLSFTHPDLVEGDIVFFTYEYDRESTEGETEIEYYDSRYVIKDSVTEKFYKWHIAVADGVPSIELAEV